MPIVLTSITPNQCPIAGNQPIVIVGTGFAVGATLRIGGALATSVVVVSANQITANAPARALAGQVNAVVYNPDATFSAGLAFHYRPEVTSVEPADGATAGGTLITFTGKGFTAGMVAYIDGTALVTNYVSATRVTATTVAHAAGAFNVDLFIAGLGAGTAWSEFWFCEPLVSGLAPAVVPLAGGQLTIRGKYFEAGATVDFGAAASPAVVRNSSTELVAQAPAGAAGVVDVVVTNADGVAGRLPGSLTYAGASVLSVTPPQGPANGVPITVLCEHLAAGAVVHIGGVLANNIVVTLPATINADAPPGVAGAAVVTVANPGEAAGATGQFTYIAQPAVTAVVPAFGPPAGGTAVSIRGADFAQGASVTIGGVAATNVLVQSPTTINATTPQHAVGPVDIVVQNPGGAPFTLAGGFDYTTITSVEPTRMRTGGQVELAVLGRFGWDASVIVGGNNAHVLMRGENLVRVLAPAHAQGAVDIEVRDNGVSMFLRGGLCYTQITSVTPPAGPLAGGSPVTIAGQGFAVAPVVSIGGALAAVNPGSTAFSLVAVTPAGVAAGPVAVVVDGMALPNGFTYLGPAQLAQVTPDNGPAAGGTVVTIEGSDFAPGATVSIGGNPATGVRIVSPTTIKATAAAHAAGAADVVVTNPGAAAATRVGGFTFRAAPTVTGVLPAQGPPAGGRTVVITGTDFVAGAGVTVGAVAATHVSFIDAQHLRARIPPHAVGQVSVVVTNPGEAAGPALVNGFEYLNAPSATGDNEAIFLLDGEEYFTEFQAQLENVRAAAPNPLTYVRMAFWMIDAATTVGNEACFGVPNHKLLSYIDKIIRAGHGVDIIAWRPNPVERPFNGEAEGVAGVNSAFAAAIDDLDAAAVRANPRSGKARIYMESYEGVIGCSNHQKMVIFSIAGQRTVLLGGLNLSPSYFAPPNHRNAAGDPDFKWHDAAIRLRGPATEDVEREWLRRWRRTDNIARTSKYQSLFSRVTPDGYVNARAFALDATSTIRQQAVAIVENTTAQAVQGANHDVIIATTRSVGAERYTRIRDLLLQRIGAADQYVYMENYHLTDPDIVRALCNRQNVRRLAGHELRVVIVVPPAGGASGYMTRRSWLQMALRFRDPAGNYYTTQVDYEDEQGAPASVLEAACNHWMVTDTYDPASPTATSWLDNDALVFHLNGAPPGNVEVRFDKITSITSTFHFYTSVFDDNDLNNIYNHSKVAIIDDRYLIVGSSNWSYRSMQYDGEMTAFIDNAVLAQATLIRLLAHYEEVTAVDATTVEAVASTNLTNYLGGLRNNQYILFPLNHHNAPNFGFGRVKPGMAQGNHTWY